MDTPHRYFVAGRGKVGGKAHREWERVQVEFHSGNGSEALEGVILRMRWNARVNFARCCSSAQTCTEKTFRIPPPHIVWTTEHQTTRWF